MKSRLSGIAVVLAAALAACAPEVQQEIGSGRVKVSTASVALSGITLTVRGPVSGTVQPADYVGVAAPEIAGSPFTLVAPPQSKSFDNLAVGWYYIDANSTGYQGHGWMQVTKNHMSTLSITMQEKAGPPTWSDAAPLISAFTATPSDPYYGQKVTLSVTASDANSSCGPYGCTNDSLTYQWSSVCSDSSYTGGVFTAPTASTTDFTSSCHGTETITIKVTDSKGIFSGIDASLTYVAEGGTVDMVVNHYPTIDNITSSDAQVHTGETIQVSASASDQDIGDVLTYQWSATCGTFNDVTVGNPVWTAPNMANGTCTLAVNVYDGHGQYSFASGSLVVQVNSL